jgi:hypothetical protein
MTALARGESSSCRGWRRLVAFPFDISNEIGY